MTEALAHVETTGLDICYETFGSPSDPAMLLVMGLGIQMIAWPDEVCRDLAGRGYQVVRFDNRDSGRSTHLEQAGSPDPYRVLLRREKPPYCLDDMAADTVGLLDALEIESAHLVGASMGGFIAQLVAIQHPTRVRSLSLLMTSTGSIRVGRPRPRVLARFGRRRLPASGRDALIEYALEVMSTIGSVGFPRDDDYLRDVMGRAYDRGHDPPAYLRQVAAVLTQANRTRALRSATVPTVVIHGLADPLIAASGGKALARALPNARFVGVPGMGHDLPRALWPTFAEEIARTAEEGERAARP